MTRRILCITDVPGDANAHARMSAALLLMLTMFRRGFSVGFRGLEKTEWHMDYAIEAPDIIPAGACYQDEIEIDDGDDKNIPEQTLMAAQFTIDREQP